MEVCLLIHLALRHQSNVVECAYVRSCVIPELTYFAAPLELGPNGIQRHLGIPPLNDYECKLLKAAIPYLRKAIALGEVTKHIHFQTVEETIYHSRPFVGSCAWR